MNSREKFLAYGAWAAVCLFWGTTYLGIRVGIETLPPMLFAGMRFLIAGIVLFSFLYFGRREALPKGREWGDLGLIGLMLPGGGTGLIFLAERWVPTGITALLIATSPFWIYAVERSIKAEERAGRTAIIGMIVGFIGLLILVVPDIGKSGINFYYYLGLLLTQIACASWSAGSVYAKRHAVEVTPLMSASVQMICAGVALTLIGTLIGEWPRFYFTTRSLIAFVYLIIFGSIIAYSSYSYAVQKLPLSLVSMYAYINPVIAVLLGWLVLGEHVGWRVGVATVAILMGVGLVKLSPTRKIKSIQATEPSHGGRTQLYT